MAGLFSVAVRQLLFAHSMSYTFRFLSRSHVSRFFVIQRRGWPARTREVPLACVPKLMSNASVAGNALRIHDWCNPLAFSQRIKKKTVDRGDDKEP
jgi:hypothetical protein